MKFKLEPLLGVLALGGAAFSQTLVDQSSKYVLSPGSPGFYSGNSSASVTFDQFSLMLDGKRLMVFSGEFHPWRLPSIPLWRDILEKMKRGTLNFEGHRSVKTFLDIAKEVETLVILRPEPYINAETTSGGMPGWVTNLADASRSNGTDFTAAWKPYMAQVSKYAAPYQYPAGPVILIQSENEFGGDSVTIQETMRSNGMTKVPTNRPGYESCYKLLNEQFANVIYKNNYAAGISLQSLYMMYGGTNWGNLAAPVVYTSYDWGAVRNNRSLTPKFHEIKIQGLFLHASPHYHLAGRVSTGTELSSSPLIFTTHLATAAGQHLYVVRQTTNANTARVEFTLDVKTATGGVTLPGLALNGRESKIFVTEYPFGGSTLRYTTAEVATWLTLDGEDHIVLYAANQTTHTVLPTPSRTKPTITGMTSSITASIASDDLRSRSLWPMGKTSVWLADKSWLSPRIWQPRVSGTTGNSIYDLSPRTGSVLVFGPYLVRNATISGSTPAIVGDSKSGAATDLEVLAPASVKSIT
ncbi:hypothetical protein FRC06_004764, partial [Ceratobasidium sp. 370]